ncbi:MAG: transposase, partial [Gammaproteobacteria bacterium]|nr:transposase [Gammaproteobacteria bacterium]
AQRIETADAETLLRWSERVLTAKTLDEMLAD